MCLHRMARPVPRLNVALAAPQAHPDTVRAAFEHPSWGKSWVMGNPRPYLRIRLEMSLGPQRCAVPYGNALYRKQGVAPLEHEI
jgi:hypothetical protein